jgi:hypothetical protein
MKIPGEGKTITRTKNIRVILAAEPMAQSIPAYRRHFHIFAAGGRRALLDRFPPPVRMGAD